MNDFDNKVVIVTGAAAGIGRVTAVAFAKGGAKVCLADINETGLSETARLIAEAGGESLISVTDVAIESDCDAMVSNTVERFGRLDVLFNNAGVGGERKVVGDMSSENWHRVIDVCLHGVFYCTRAAIEQMLKVGGGVIINTSSVDGLIGMGTVSPYVAAKHGVIGLTKNIALEYRRKNIRCVAVCPGYIKTELVESTFSDEERAGYSVATPLGRGADPQEVANFVIWAASDKASFGTGSALAIVVIGVIALPAVAEADKSMVSLLHTPAHPVGKLEIEQADKCFGTQFSAGVESKRLTGAETGAQAGNHYN